MFSRLGVLCIALTSLALAGFAQDVDPRSETAAGPPKPLNDGELRAAYMDLLGRPPLAAEREKWLKRGRKELCAELVGSRDFWEHWLEEQLYFFLLIDNFRPESERVATIPESLAAGKLDVRDAIHRIALSPSFDQRNPGADTFVTVVMEQMNGIRVQKSVRELEIGKAIYDGESGVFLGQTGSNQADIVRIAIEDKSFAEKLVEREYARLVRGEPDKRELGEWVRALHRDPSTYAELVRDWIDSPAWDQRVSQRIDMPNRLFVRALFVDLLGRLPSEEEARRLRSALDGLSDPGPLRSVFARILIDSGQVALPERFQVKDPAAWVTDLFQRLLGRAPRESELATFVAAFQDPMCRPQTVLYALVTHPEYQSY